MKFKWIKLIISISMCLLAGAVGSYFTLPSIATWYSVLEKPLFNPPNWIFGPVWTILYIFMGTALYLIWSRDSKNQRPKVAYQLFALQLLLNVLWSITFFDLKNTLLAFMVIVALWLSIFVTAYEFARISKTAAKLLFPYLIWVAFAAILNLSIFILNY